MRVPFCATVTVVAGDCVMDDLRDQNVTTGCAPERGCLHGNTELVVLIARRLHMEQTRVAPVVLKFAPLVEILVNTVNLAPVGVGIAVTSAVVTAVVMKCIVVTVVMKNILVTAAIATVTVPTVVRSACNSVA